jgi:hypothetical protein
MSTTLNENAIRAWQNVKGAHGAAQGKDFQYAPFFTNVDRKC